MALTMFRASDVKLKLKADEFTLFLREMQGRLRSSVTYSDIVDYEVARVLEKAADLTGRADREKIRHYVENRVKFKVDGKRYRLSDWRTGKPWRVPDRVWSHIQARNARSLQRRLAAVGISKKSWLDLATKMGYEVNVPGYVRSATVTKDTSGNTSTKTTEGNSSFTRTVENKAPLMFTPAVEGYQAFFSALSGRIKFFMQNMARGVFDTAESVAKKYPGMKVARK